MSVLNTHTSFSKVVSWNETQNASALDENLSANGDSCIGNARVAGSSLCDVSSLGTSSGMSASVNLDLAAPPDVLGHLKALLASGVSVSEAVGLAQGMISCYMCYARGKLEAVNVSPSASASSTSDGVVQSAGSSKRALRRERNKAYGNALAEQDGFCYLRPLRRDRRKQFHRELGPSPTWIAFAKMITPKDLDALRVNTCRVYRLDASIVANGYHIAHEGEQCDGLDVGSFADVLNSLRDVLGFARSSEGFRPPLVVPVGVVSGKVKCNECGFFVNPVGHSDRCKIQLAERLAQHLETRQTWDVVDKLARYGDTVHKWDVNIALRAQQVDWPDMEAASQNYITSETQANYMRRHGQNHVHLSASGTSVRKLSCAFEASYLFTRFREMYLHVMFPEQRQAIESSMAGGLNCASVVGDVLDDVFTRLVIPEPPMQGYCYLSVFQSIHRARLAHELGFNPTFGSIMKHVRVGQIDQDKWLSARVYRVGDGQYHVTTGSSFTGDYVGTAVKVFGMLAFSNPETSGAFAPVFEASVPPINLTDCLGLDFLDLRCKCPDDNVVEQLTPLALLCLAGMFAVFVVGLVVVVGALVRLLTWLAKWLCTYDLVEVKRVVSYEDDDSNYGTMV